MPPPRLPFVLTVILGAAIASLAPGPAFAQERPTLDTLDSRLSRIERVLDQSLLDQLQRIDGLQRELRELRGEMERLDNENRRLSQRSSDLYDDTDQRLTELEEAREEADRRAATAVPLGPDGLPLPGFEGGLDELSLGAGSLDETARPDGAGADKTAGASPGRFVTSRSRAGEAGGNQPIEVRTNATQAEKAAYTRAYDLLARGDNSAAVADFDAFLEEYPDGPYSFNAWYWKGEAMYAERRFDDAIENFRMVTESFPTSTKVPDAQLKIGFSLYEQSEFARARAVLEAVRDNFQGRSAGVLARKRLQKMDREGV